MVGVEAEQEPLQQQHKMENGSKQAAEPMAIPAAEVGGCDVRLRSSRPPASVPMCTFGTWLWALGYFQLLPRQGTRCAACM